MSNDKTTLADVQPGGRVRLGDQAERARFEAWAHAQSYRGGNIMADRDSVHTDVYADPIAQLTWKSWQAALFAHPSPGGQDALASLQQDYDKLLDSFNRQVEVAEKIAGRVLQQDDRIEELEEALAARQPVGEPFAYTRATTAVDPLPVITPAEYAGLRAQGHGERFRALVFADAAPTAQAVDLAPAPAAIPDTPEVRDILGRPNFWCSPWANILRRRGDVIPCKAEEEQAAVIRFMLNHYLAHGAGWADAAEAELQAIRYQVTRND